MPGESSSETENPYGRMYVTEPVRATIPVQNGARLSWDPWIFPHYGVWPERASLSLPSASFAPVTRHAARPRSERSVCDPFIIWLLFHLPTFIWRVVQLFIAFLPNFPPLWCVAQAGQLIIAFLLFLHPLWRAAYPRSESSVGGPVIICLLFHLSTFMARGPSGPAFIAFLPNSPPPPPPLWRAVRVGQLIIACLRNLPPLWRADRPRSGRSVGGPVIICLLFHLPTFMARGPSRPAYRLPFCSICPRFGAWLERACLSMPCCSLKSAARAGQLIICPV